MILIFLFFTLNNLNKRESLKFTYKKPDIQIINESLSIDSDDMLKQQTYKYADYSLAHTFSTPSVRNLLNSVPHDTSFKYRIVDVKIGYLRVGQAQANLFWHTDCTMNPWDASRPENNYIFISGANCRTEFIYEDISIDYKSNNYILEMNKSIKEANPKTVFIDENIVYKYDRFAIHRANKAKSDGLRLLIRVTETDLIRPRGKINE